jgi:hypothetical protein
MQNFSHPVSPGYQTTGTCNRAFQAGRRKIIVGLASWFNRCAFALNALGTFGDERTGVLRSPYFQDWDMGLAKNFAVRESIGLQLELEAFNVFNHPS